jgi:hypothetical protein
MNDETEAPIGAAEPIAARDSTPRLSVADHAEAAARDWYEQHYLAASRSGRTPITSDELKRLIVQVRAAASITNEE